MSFAHRLRLIHRLVKHGHQRGFVSWKEVPMSESLLICNVSASRGTSPVVLALLDYFQRSGFSNVGYFVPIPLAKCSDDENPSCSVSARVDLVRAALGLDDDPRDMQGVAKDKALDMIARGRREDLAEDIYARFAEYKRKYNKDMTVVEGGLLEGLSSSIELNAWLSNELSAPMLMLYDCQNDDRMSAEDIMRRVSVAKGEIESRNADLAGLVLNRVPPSQLDVISDEMRRAAKQNHCAFAGCIPNDHLLQSPRLNEVAKNLNAEFLFGNTLDADVDVSTLLVAAQDVPHLLSKINKFRAEGSAVPLRPLVLTTPDRADVLLALGCLHASKLGPSDWSGVAGVLLCDYDGKMLDDHVRSALGNFDHIFPVYGTRLPVTEAIQTLTRSSQSSKILATSTTKIERAKFLFNEHIDMEVISSQLSNPKRDGKTPKMFLHDMYEVCRRNPRRIVLPEASDTRILRAAADVTNRGLANILLLGDAAQVRADAARLNIDISACDIMDFRQESALIEEFAKIWTEERKHKGATYERSVDMMSDRNVFGTMLCKTGRVDGMVSGAACTTAATIRPALTVMRKGLVSSVFLMCLRDRVLVFGDCAVNVDPTAEQLSHIAASAAEMARAFGIDPRIAMISYSTGMSGSGPMVEKVQKATAILKESHPELMVEGPVQYDAAINEAVAKEKIKDSEVAGHATVLIFPDLSTGNAVYKAVQQSSKGILAIGPLLQGLAKPVNDLSRGATVQDISNTICATSMQALDFASKQP